MLINTLLKKLIIFLEMSLVLIYLVFEEILWNRIGQPLYKRIKCLKLYSRFEAYLNSDINPWILLSIFLLPFVLMEVMAVLAGKMFLTGHFYLGLFFYSLKAAATVPVVTIFSLGKEKLLQFKIIKLGYNMILWLIETKVYQNVATIL